MSKDVSIEYAHIYTNNKIGEEHKTSLSILGELKDQLSRDNQTSSLVIMVDDYSFPDPSFDYDAFSEWLAEHNSKPDFLIRESQLIPICDEVLNLIKNAKIREPVSDYIRAKKYPCSLFIAAWYLVRLGHIKTDLFDESLVAQKLINILPKSFKPFEDKALELIAATSYKGVVEKIDYQFFEGRLIA